MADSSPVTLGGIATALAPTLVRVEGDIDTFMASLGDGENLSAGALLQGQLIMAKYSVFVQLETSIVKDISDDLKAVVQKF